MELYNYERDYNLSYNTLEIIEDLTGHIFDREYLNDCEMISGGLLLNVMEDLNIVKENHNCIFLALEELGVAEYYTTEYPVISYFVVDTPENLSKIKTSDLIKKVNLEEDLNFDIKIMQKGA